MSMDVEQLLNSLRSHGTIDPKEGSFTLSLSEARRKLLNYQSSNPRRYLVVMFAGFQAAGADRITLASDWFRYKITALSARVSEQALTEAFAGRGDEAKHPGVSDLTLSLRLAFRCECHQLSFSQHVAGEPGYGWTLSGEAEVSVPVAPSRETLQTVELEFRPSWKRRAEGFFRGLGGFVGKNEELRLLVQHCDKSRVPILVDGETIAYDHLEKSSHPRAWVGSEQASGPYDVLVANLPWEGWLDLEEGRLDIVHHGVTFSRLEIPGLSGIVWHSGLRLDLSREAILHDAHYEHFLSEVEQVRSRLLKIFSLNLNSRPPEEVWRHLHDLVFLCLDKMDPNLNRRMNEWMVTQLEKTSPGIATADKWELLRNYQELPRVRRGFKPRVQATLALCASSLDELSPGLDELLSDTATLIQQFYPKDYLAAAYLLLGLGACLHNFGQPNVGRTVWEEALETAKASSDDRNVELIEAHLKFEVDHMISEVAKAIRMYLASKSEEQW